ncbi:MAG: hypothetical protein FWF57_09205 [Defluviitaleaceae bacterium]|nr:hypothetical protein [Defluviitaleaceae bacterium]
MNIFNFDTTYTSLPEKFFSKENIKPFPNAKMLIFNHGLSKELNIKSSENIDIFLKQNEYVAMALQGINLVILQCLEMVELF